MCSLCEQVFPLNNRYFYGSEGGYSVYCKTCDTQRANQQRRHEEPDLSSKEWRFIKSLWLDGGVVMCAYCGESAPSPERDHVRPLSDGGETRCENIVPACATCNRKKSHKDVNEWYPESDVFDPTRWDKIQRHLRGDTPIPS